MCPGYNISQRSIPFHFNRILQTEPWAVYRLFNMGLSPLYKLQTGCFLCKLMSKAWWADQAGDRTSPPPMLLFLAVYFCVLMFYRFATKDSPKDITSTSHNTPYPWQQEIKLYNLKHVNINFVSSPNILIN